MFLCKLHIIFSFQSLTSGTRLADCRSEYQGCLSTFFSGIRFVGENCKNAANNSFSWPLTWVIFYFNIFIYNLIIWTWGLLGNLSWTNFLRIMSFIIWGSNGIALQTMVNKMTPMLQISANFASIGSLCSFTISGAIYLN